MSVLLEGLLTNLLAHLGILFLPVLGIVVVVLVILKVMYPRLADHISYGLSLFHTLGLKQQRVAHYCL
jgi:hypothetical protein